jgi:hypothetical protein
MGYFLFSVNNKIEVVPDETQNISYPDTGYRHCSHRNSTRKTGTDIIPRTVTAWYIQQ